MTHWPYIHFGWLIPTAFVSFALGMLLKAMMADAKARDKRAGRVEPKLPFDRWLVEEALAVSKRLYYWHSRPLTEVLAKVQQVLEEVVGKYADHGLDGKTPKNETRIHVVPDPESDGWLTLRMTDQEAFEWDCEHYGKSVALDNWETLHRDDPLKASPGGEG